ncbi:hypothetical protein Pla108_02100 [Botrimarina colliarenosi]|uniref:Lipoprotein n=1 Tax=Botrimarina colliarenosi TaxID=2528001 RepID=A0A5C6AJD1_9BACT|nr:hypothetical protein [Botrimarina colliarenosi]TWT99275.1 hypothetical protein Pla108_02100 [Botrimarina colliarenosi]
MNRGPQSLLLALAPLVFLASGCSLLLPEVAHQPVVHNPFPQLSRVAVVPFFNQSAEPTVDGREFALAYYAELQGIPGFEVVPVAAVEAAIRQYGVTFDPPEQAVEQARWLAKKLGVDAVVIGTVTDYSPYYPPRCGMRVEWYAANPGFHEIPAGYGLPWGTSQEEFIPDRLVFEAEMALARAQMETQSPTVVNATEQAILSPLREPMDLDSIPPMDPFDDVPPKPVAPPARAEELPTPGEDADNGAGAPFKQAAYEEPMNGATGSVDASGAGGAFEMTGAMPPNWPDARGFTPPGPTPVRPVATPNPGPVMTHTRVFRGNDPEFTVALASYVDFRDDARFGGWQSYLSRSEDFIRFCCHQHLVEMLSARGGGDETRVVRRWSDGR